VPGTTGRHAAVLLPTSGLTYRFRCDAVRWSASRHEACAGEGFRFHYQAEKRISLSTAERIQLCVWFLSTEISAHFRLKLTNCGELLGRPRIFTIRDVVITQQEVIVTFDKRAHNPYLVASGLADTPTPMPWYGNKRLVIRFS